MITLSLSLVSSLRCIRGLFIALLVGLLCIGMIGCLDPVGDPGSPPLEEELSSDGGLYEPQRPSSSSPYGGSGSGSGSNSGSGVGGSGSSLKSITLDSDWVESISVCQSSENEDEDYEDEDFKEEECEEDSTRSASFSSDDE